MNRPGERIGWPEGGARLVVVEGSAPMAEEAHRVRRFLEEVEAAFQAQRADDGAARPPTCWVLVRVATEGVRWYAIEPDEFVWHADNAELPLDRAVAEHLALSERNPSPVVRGHPRPSEVDVPEHDRWSMTLSRVVHLDDNGTPLDVGTWGQHQGAPPPPMAPPPMAAPPMAAPDAPRASLGLGTLPTLGMGGAPGRARSRGIEPEAPREASAPEPPDAGDAAPTFQATLSAQAPQAMEPGQTEFVEVRIERDDDHSMPLEHAVSGVEVLEEEPIQVLLSVRGSAVRVVGSRRLELAPPAPGRASVAEFEVEAVAEGEVQFGISFRQVGSELGSVRLSTSVARRVEVDAHAAGRAREAVEALPRDPADDAILRLLIDEMEEDGRTFYRYRLISEPLGLHYLTVDSQPLLDRDGGSASKLDDYVARIHDKLTRELRRRSDLAQFQVELEAAGVSLCRELLSPAVARVLWPLRSQIEGVQITSWEPRIPWEVVRLQDPDSGEVDDRYLAEYGLVRTFHGRTPPRELPLNRWTYLAASYPHGTEASVTTEVDFLTRFLPDQGVKSQRLAPGFEPLWKAISEGGFDVLHLACHGLADPGRIQGAALLIGDQPGAEEGDPPEPIRIEAESVRSSRALWAERPLVFLHACEAGRHGLGLTEWGGWPTAFMEAGAGAFVGASWPVRDQPAEAFANAFYQALWSGATLAEAAQAARRKGRELGDASWLAFKVYGHPRARRRMEGSAGRTGGPMGSPSADPLH